MKRFCLSMHILAAAAAVFLSGCSADDGGDSTRLPVIQNIVEYAGAADGLTTFVYYAPWSDNAETLLARGEYQPGDLAEGDAVLLAYTADPAAAGYISIEGTRNINNLTLMQTEPEGLEGWDSEGVRLISAWRAGPRLNLRLNLTYDSEPRRFAIVVDKTTLDAPYPTAYLFHRRGSDTPNFSREYYVSCSLSALFSRESVKGLQLRLLDTGTSSGVPQVRTLTFAR